MRAVIIGADGFAGRWLVRHLHECGDEVTALVGPKFRPPLEAPGRIESVDVRDASSIERAIHVGRPDRVFYLAGVSQAQLRDDLSLAVGVSVIGSMNTLLACAGVSPPPKLLFVSSGYVYQPSPGAVDEFSNLNPDSTYAAAKLAGEQALLSVAPSAGVDVVIARPFNHIGPGQADAFVVPTLARQIMRDPTAAQATISITDASPVRDFTDVRDVVAAYRLLVERGAPGTVYNVASGRGSSIREVALALGVVAGVDVRIEEGKPTPRPSDRPVMIGDARRLEALGWQRRHAIAETLADVLKASTTST